MLKVSNSILFSINRLIIVSVFHLYDARAHVGAHSGQTFFSHGPDVDRWPPIEEPCPNGFHAIDCDTVINTVIPCSLVWGLVSSGF